MKAIEVSDIERLVSSPSVGAIAYQTLSLIQELTRINDEDFPPQTRRVRDVLMCLAEHSLEQLWGLYDEGDPYQPRGGTRGAARLRSLGKLTQELYSYIRYLLASSPRQSPPAIQFAVSQLSELHFPKHGGEALCLVRPQWKYNLKCVQLTSHLKNIVSPAVLDPDNVLGAKNFDDLMEILWKKPPKQFEKIFIPGRSEPEPPKQLAILSFAGLDTNDTLCYPLLAHELGHFIDFSRKPPFHLSEDLRQKSEIQHDDVEKILTRHRKHGKRDVDPGEIDSYRNSAVQRTYVCLRELLADLLATRMMGLSFFVAQSEFLKTLFSWTEPRITPSGYPGFQFRLWSILRHLLDERYTKNPLVFLKNSTVFEQAPIIIQYLGKWSDKLRIQDDEPPDGAPHSGSILQTEMSKLAERAVLKSLESLNQLSRIIIPDENCAELTPTFFKRINMLQAELPPSLATEGPQSFGEIMSAAWAYQIVYGDKQEASEDKKTIEKKYEEYAKTCRLILKAIELIPVARHTDERNATHITSRETDEKWLEKHGVLNDYHIRARISLPIGHSARLAVMPFKSEAINEASIDVHLGNWFAYARRTKLNEVKVGDAANEKLLMTIGREEVFIPPDKTFLLHPGDLVLGVTQEFLALPNDVMAFVEGRSGLGRLGLFVATATQVAPGYHGVIVLELANAGTVPLKLGPGMAIAQLVFQVMTDKTHGYRGKYHCQIKP